ncbi:hypothetical protein ACWD64_01660 [Streptomyces antibioticus]|uniref:hypothetical protein n=1 Tax=Streptomyces antibioticus TaxID=1890 RepID=UPI003F456251
MPWPTVDIERADVPGHEPFAATRANVDISYVPSATLRFLKLTWLDQGRRPVDAVTPTDESTPRTVPSYSAFSPHTSVTRG